MELSVIIVSYNVREYLKQCLQSVRKAASSLECEIFVVDNDSSDGSCEMVSEEFPEVILIRNKVNSGFSAANNLAIHVAKGKFVLLLNPDTIVEHDAFTRCVGFMKDHTDAGALGVKMINGDGEFLPESKRAFPTPLIAFFKTFGLSALFSRSSFFNRYYLIHINKDETALTEAISGAFMFIRKEALNKAGGPDESFFMYGEDIDLSYRLIQAGYKNYYFPGVRIIHFKGKSTLRVKYNDIFHFYKAMRIYAGKRNLEKSSVLYLIIVPAIYLREGIAILVRFLRNTFLR